MSQFLLKEPSAYLPLAMSLAALAIVLAHYAVYGIVHLLSHLAEKPASWYFGIVTRSP
jgi:hypothetical protein